MSKALKAVLISDIHFNLANLEPASISLKAALTYAENYDVPLIIAGDLLDTKAIIRAECANRLIEIIGDVAAEVIVIPGNHDMINEKGTEHALHFLEPLLFDEPTYYKDIHFIPYQSDPAEFLSILNSCSKKTIIAHQGIAGAYMGDYVFDKSEVRPDTVVGYRVISGHYHRAQTIPCAEGGSWSYIGSPYTITYAEANDGPKGFQLLHEDGSLTQVPLDLRRHTIVCRQYTDFMDPIPDLRPIDLLWLKVSGPYSELQKLNKQEIGMHHLTHSNFKLDLIATKDDTMEPVIPTAARTASEELDSVIDNCGESKEQIGYLKELYRGIL